MQLFGFEAYFYTFLMLEFVVILKGYFRLVK